MHKVEIRFFSISTRKVNRANSLHQYRCYLAYMLCYTTNQNRMHNKKLTGLTLHLPPQVLRLLQVAWERKLTFTIGTSVTTGATDTVVWNEIHHKTESSSNHSGHGYPDPNYLDNVLMELSLQGVTESDSSDDSL